MLDPGVSSCLPGVLQRVAYAVGLVDSLHRQQIPEGLVKFVGNHFIAKTTGRSARLPEALSGVASITGRGSCRLDALWTLSGRRPAPGFTIVELMVVIAILAAISIVAYTGVRQRAATSSAQTDLRQLATIFEMYRLDHGQFPHNNEAIGNALDHYADVGALGRQSLTTDGKRHLYCTKDDGTDIWINAEISPVQMEQNGFGSHQFWQGTTGRISTAEPLGSASDFPSGAQWACTSITGGEHDAARWPSASVFQQHLGRQ